MTSAHRLLALHGLFVTLFFTVILALVLWCVSCSSTDGVVRRNTAAPGQPEKYTDFDQHVYRFMGITLYLTEAPKPRMPGPIQRVVDQYAPALKIGGWCSLALGLAGIIAACMCASNGTLARWFSWGVRLAVAGVGCWLLCLALTTVLELWLWITIIGGCLLAAVNDAADWQAKLRTILADPSALQRLQQAAARRPLPRWADAARNLLDGLD